MTEDELADRIGVPRAAWKMRADGAVLGVQAWDGDWCDGFRLKLRTLNVVTDEEWQQVIDDLRAKRAAG